MIADLHCDLLAYLAMDSRYTPYDRVARCSIPQLQTGGVKLQVLAVYTFTMRESVLLGSEQVKIYQKLPQKYPEAFTFEKPVGGQTQIVMAFENASGFAEEDEPLDVVLKRLQDIQGRVNQIAYVSLTWNGENRFGGGNLTKVGLKEDGKELLRTMDRLGIAVDLSHTSDALARDILDLIDKEGLKLGIIASHSNARDVCNQPRNLPLDLIREIIQRKGLIGLNFFGAFVGDGGWTHLASQAEYILCQKGADALCFGADFFYNGKVPPAFVEKYPDMSVAMAMLQSFTGDQFFQECADASCYPRVCQLLSEKLRLNEEQLSKIRYHNVLNLLGYNIYDFL